MSGSTFHRLAGVANTSTLHYPANNGRFENDDGVVGLYDSTNRSDKVMSQSKDDARVGLLRLA